MRGIQKTAALQNLNSTGKRSSAEEEIGVVLAGPLAAQNRKVFLSSVFYSPIALAQWSSPSGAARMVNDVEMQAQAQWLGHGEGMPKHQTAHPVQMSRAASSRVLYVRRLTLSGFSSWNTLSATALSWQLPRRLMLGSRLCWRRKICQSRLVNCEPWSECPVARLPGLRRQTAIS